jgi:4'-phosphopantetheinyl transferase
MQIDDALAAVGINGEKWMSAVPERVAARGRWPADVSVWRVDIPLASKALALMRQILDETERRRADRYHRPADQARFIVARHSLRVLLGADTGKAPQALRFDSGPHGKPTLADYPQLAFNVSHSGDHALIAISRERHVGIDIERLDMAFDWQQLAEVVCTGDERRAIMRLPEPQRAPAFFRCWTAKEALLKTLGLGITEGLHCVAVDPFGNATQRPRAAPGSIAAGAAALRFHWLHEIPAYVGCIAYGEARGAAG